MIWFLCILSIFTLLNAWVWLRLRKTARALKRQRLWQTLLAAFFITLMLAMYFVLLGPRFLGHAYHNLPQRLAAAIYIWQILLMPITAVLLLIGSGIERLIQFIKPRRDVRVFVPLPEESETPAQEKPASQDKGTTRRQFLGMAAVAIPPLATFSLSGAAMAQLGTFRVNPYRLAVPGWPKALDGFTIAVVADIHAGVFTTPRMLRDVVETTNNLRADMIVLPGDLINMALGDLPNALDMVMKLDAPQGIHMVQGNHDVIQNETVFNTQTKARGVNLLLDEVLSLRPRGVPIQLLGIKWPQLSDKSTDMPASVASVARQRDPGAFPILLAHHPHAWDEARKHNLPLTLSGHTHGGQLMLTKNIGGGPLRFKYWTGVYETPDSRLLISNGVGNWFPLRVNAPAEILHVTLHSA